jgi:hypothetical protein
MSETSRSPRTGRFGPLRLSDLSNPCQRLVRLLQATHFGRVLDLHVKGGQPVFDPPPRVVRTVKMCGRNEPRPQAAAADFVLKLEVVELLDQLERVGDGLVERIEVSHGLPLLAEVREPVIV